MPLPWLNKKALGKQLSLLFVQLKSWFGISASVGFNTTRIWSTSNAATNLTSFFLGCLFCTRRKPIHCSGRFVNDITLPTKLMCRHFSSETSFQDLQKIFIGIRF